MPMVVFFDATILIAASVREVETSPSPIEHEFYDSSIGLIRLISREIVGITSYTVEEQAKHKVEKGLKDTIVERIGTRYLTDMDREMYSTILDKVERNFKANIRVLDILSTNLKEVRKIKTEEVLPMYGEIAEDIPPRTWSLTKKFKPVAKYIDRMQIGRYYAGLKWKEIIPEESDLEILSEAICLKRNRFTADNFFVASSDKHFSGSSKDPWDKIPLRINELFKISCLYPHEIINRIQSSK
jgi:hypothetical protein